GLPEMRVVGNVRRGVVAEARHVVAEASGDGLGVVVLAESPGHGGLGRVPHVVVEALRVGVPQHHRVGQAALTGELREGGRGDTRAGSRVYGDLQVDDLDITARANGTVRVRPGDLGLLDTGPTRSNGGMVRSGRRDRQG